MRLIDADALSEKLCETTIFIKDGEVFQRMINDAPTVSAEAVQGWIPCSERLPDVGKIVIASWSDLWSDAIVFARRYCEDDWEWAYEQGSDYWESARDYDRESNPEAWMHSPEPYKQKTERRG